MYRGISFYAAGNKNFPHKKAIRCFSPENERPALVTMLSFGTVNIVPKFFCNFYDDRVHMWEIHFGFRDFTTSQLLKMSPKTQKEIVKRCDQVEKMIDLCAVNTTTITLCPMCEDNVTLDAWKRYARIIRDKMPENAKRLVRSTLRKHEGGNYEEAHGTEGISPHWSKPKSRTIANLDGYPIKINKGQKYSPHCDPKFVEKWLTYKSAGTKFVWEADPQGLRYSKPGGYLPPFNKRKYILTRKAINWYYNNVK